MLSGVLSRAGGLPNSASVGAMTGAAARWRRPRRRSRRLTARTTPDRGYENACVLTTRMVPRGPVSLGGRGARAGAWLARQSAVVRELQGDAEVLLLEQRDHGLQVVALLRRDPKLVTLDL